MSTQTDSARKRPPKKQAERPCILLALGWYSPAIHRGIARYARQAGWVLDASMARDGSIPRPRSFDGIVSLLREGRKLRDFVARCGKPVVNIGDIRLPGIPNVRCNDAAIGHLAADHFLSRGFRHAAFFLRSRTPSALERMRAFEQCLLRQEATFYLIDATSARTRASRQGQPIDWLGGELMKLPRPLAVFSEHDEASIEVLNACRARQIPVPEQVAVLGVDNDPLRCDFAPVPLSSIDNNQEAEGYHAAALLGQLLKGKTVRKSETLIPPLGVTTRLSTEIFAVEHPHVASALRHIWQHYTGPVNAKTVAATVPISYRRLHDAFQQSLGRTLAEEITLKRLEKAQQLLVDTKLRAHEIAHLSGFPGEDRMGRVFRRILNQSPLEYRKKNSLAGTVEPHSLCNGAPFPFCR
ncbi:XylR family transcriptional regulator [Ruficoccus amylovorans]|uniref:XylR family transcriptional regulator n=1 Tax=Ruficoccus amylovorans TaxID=1804625 RepID=UPI001C8C091D